MQHNETVPRKPHPTLITDFYSGVISGVFYSSLFHPWDRAVYLSVTSGRPFFSRDNFVLPYHGLLQSICQRAFLGSGYYLVQGQMRSQIGPALRQHVEIPDVIFHLITGCAAGTVHGLITNTPALVRAHTWRDASYSFVGTVKNMYQKAGLMAFTRGLATNMSRDALYGGTYEVCRHHFRHQVKAWQAGTVLDHVDIRFPCDALASALATIVVSPLGYLRFMKYAAPLKQSAPGVSEIMTAVWQKSRIESQGLLARIGFFQRHFCIGVSTARAAVGMAVGQKVFDEVRARLSKI